MSAYSDSELRLLASHSPSDHPGALGECWECDQADLAHGLLAARKALRFLKRKLPFNLKADQYGATLCMDAVDKALGTNRAALSRRPRARGKGRTR